MSDEQYFVIRKDDDFDGSVKSFDDLELAESYIRKMLKKEERDLEEASEIFMVIHGESINVEIKEEEE